jgi:hypothetical protein
MYSLACLAAGLGIFADPGVGPPAAAGPEPLHGVVTHGVVFVTHLTNLMRGNFADMVDIEQTSLDGLRPTRTVIGCSVSVPDVAPVRWQIGHRGIWVSHASHNEGIGIYEPLPSEGLHRYALADFLNGKAVIGRAAEKDSSWLPSFARAWPFTRTLRFRSTFARQGYYDWLPTGPNRVKLFVLTNVRGRIEPEDAEEMILVMKVNQTEEEKNNPVWSLTTHTWCGAEWNTKTREWDRGTWSHDEPITVGFHEPFQVLAKGETYYFVTSSGRVYAAPVADKGKERPMKPVWTDASRPVTVFVEDADAGRTFLFCKPAKKGEEGVYFELAEKADPLPYDPGALPEAKAPEALQTVLRHARFLVAGGKIKAK